MNESPCSILVVEDDEKMQDMLRTLLASQASSIDFASDGEIAIEMLQASTYDVVVLDLMLPKKNGLVVAETVATLPYKPKLIVLSAISRYFHDRFPEGTQVLQKPFEIDELAEAVSCARAGIPRESSLPPAPAQ